LLDEAAHQLTEMRLAGHRGRTTRTVRYKNTAMTSEAIVERAFIRLPSGRVHYRYADGPADADRPPLYMAHAGPGCSRGLETLIAELGQTRHVIAPDMLGNGDSDPPRLRKTSIAFYADIVVETIDALGIERVDFYGDHTGAQIGIELAVAHPDRIGRLVLDGVPLFSTDLKQDLLANYAPVLAADDYGGHLAFVWGFIRDLTVHFPYYRTDPAYRLMKSPILPVEERHRLCVDVLKSLTTYHLAYNAAFSQDTAALLTRLTVPTLVMASDADPLGEYLETAAALAPGAIMARVSRPEKAATIRDFLDTVGPRLG
jgi:pimeloyl-ACP methyl ester carboxylesterase